MLQGASYFTRLDAKNAYMAIPVAKESRPLLAFEVPQTLGNLAGRYQFKALPYGYINSGEVYNHAMAQILSPFIGKVAISYVDDTVIYTKGDLKHHLETVEEVLQHLKQAGVQLKFKKMYIRCNFNFTLGSYYRQRWYP